MPGTYSSGRRPRTLSRLVAATVSFCWRELQQSSVPVLQYGSWTAAALGREQVRKKKEVERISYIFILGR